MVRGSTEADLKVDVATLPTNLFIGGAWVKSGNAKRIEVLNPSTEECLATMRLGGRRRHGRHPRRDSELKFCWRPIGL
jgi:hypothetical protein